MQIEELGEQVGLLRESETFQMWQSPERSTESIQQVERRVRDRLNRERDRLDEAIIDYNRLVRRRRLSLISVDRAVRQLPRRIVVPPGPHASGRPYRTRPSALTALFRRSKASHGYDDEFMRAADRRCDTVIAAEEIARNTFMVAEIDGRMAGFAHLMPIDRPGHRLPRGPLRRAGCPGPGRRPGALRVGADRGRARGLRLAGVGLRPQRRRFLREDGRREDRRDESTLVPGRMIPRFRMPTGLSSQNP